MKYCSILNAENMVAMFFGNFLFDCKICGFMNDFDAQNFRIFFRKFFKHFLELNPGHRRLYL